VGDLHQFPLLFPRGRVQVKPSPPPLVPCFSSLLVVNELVHFRSCGTLWILGRILLRLSHRFETSVRPAPPLQYVRFADSCSFSLFAGSSVLPFSASVSEGSITPFLRTIFRPIEVDKDVVSPGAPALLSLLSQCLRSICLYCSPALPVALMGLLFRSDKLKLRVLVEGRLIALSVKFSIVLICFVK